MLGNAGEQPRCPKPTGRSWGKERRSRGKLPRKAARTQFITVSHFASTPPLKPSLVFVPLTWEVQFALENFLLPPPTIISYSKAPCRNHNFPQTCQPALLAQPQARLALILFSWPRHALGFIFIRKHHVQINCVVTAWLPASPSPLRDALQQAPAPSPLLSPGKVTDQETGINTELRPPPSQKHSSDLKSSVFQTTNHPSPKKLSGGFFLSVSFKEKTPIFIAAAAAPSCPAYQLLIYLNKCNKTTQMHKHREKERERKISQS